jgi:hypothetical protein
VSAQFSGLTKRGYVLGENCNMLKIFAIFWRKVIKQIYPLEVEIQFI